MSENEGGVDGLEKAPRVVVLYANILYLGAEFKVLVKGTQY